MEGHFMLVTDMNPCPCGYFGDPQRECRCSPRQIESYPQRISGPLVDRTLADLGGSKGIRLTMCWRRSSFARWIASCSPDAKHSDAN